LGNYGSWTFRKLGKFPGNSENFKISSKFRKTLKFPANSEKFEIIREILENLENFREI
jgi:hypothetical protein